MDTITQIKLDLIEYHQSLTNTIDIKTQSHLNRQQQTLDEAEHTALLGLSQSFATRCNDVLDKNIAALNDTMSPKSQSDIDEIKSTILTCDCLLIEESIRKFNTPLGLLYTTDWWMNKNEKTFTQKLFSIGDMTLLNVQDERDQIDNDEELIDQQTFFVLSQNLTLIKYVYDKNKQKLPDILILSKSIIANELAACRTFSISGFQFNTIEQNAFQLLINLRELSLSGSRINTLVGHVFKLRHLKKLEMYACSIKLIEVNAFLGLTHLEYLNLGHNPQIDLNNAGQFNGLSNLLRLNLSDNDFKYDINTMRIFENLSSLTELDLTLSSLRRRVDMNMFRGLVCLEKLELTHCMLTECCRSFVTLTNLKELDLRYNYLMNIDTDTFKGLVNLERLDLQDCSVNKIAPGSFKECTKLRWLCLVRNEVECLGSSVFEGLDSLNELRLDFRLDISLNAFAGLDNLRSLGFIRREDVLPQRNEKEIKRVFNLGADVNVTVDIAEL